MIREPAITNIKKLKNLSLKFDYTYCMCRYWIKNKNIYIANFLNPYKTLLTKRFYYLLIIHHIREHDKKQAYAKIYFILKQTKMYYHWPAYIRE